MVPTPFILQASSPKKRKMSYEIHFLMPMSTKFTPYDYLWTDKIKNMAFNQTNKLVWLVKLISRMKKITFADINRQWVENVDMSGGIELSKRTFHKWRQSIFDTFGLNIECEKGGGYRYYICNIEDLHSGSIEEWLLNTFSVANSLQGSVSIKDRIILEDVPSGVQYLEQIIGAIKTNHFIHISYYNYRYENEREHYVMPLCVKLFRQRWYMVSRVWKTNQDLVFCLDRIISFRLSSHCFVYPKDFNAERFFQACFGVIVGVDTKVEHVVLRVATNQANYLRDLPMHKTQKECERNALYSIFEMDIRPTTDFQQEILWNGEYVEVLKPEWLRKEIAKRVKRMNNQYNL